MSHPSTLLPPAPSHFLRHQPHIPTSPTTPMGPTPPPPVPPAHSTLGGLRRGSGSAQLAGQWRGAWGPVGGHQRRPVTCSRSRLGFGPLFLYPDARSLSSLGAEQMEEEKKTLVTFKGK